MKNAKNKTIVNSLTFFTCLITILITLTLFNLSFYLFSKPKVTYVTDNPINKEVSFWQSFLTSHPTYVEGWVALAKLDLQKGDKNAAEIAFQNAWKINPNSIKIQTLKNEVQN